MEVISITPMQERMLRLVQQGKTDREIAQIIKCPTTNAVKQRLLKLRQKTGCSSTKELLVYAYENNLFTKQPLQ